MVGNLACLGELQTQQQRVPGQLVDDPVRRHGRWLAGAVVVQFDRDCLVGVEEGVAVVQQLDQTGHGTTRQGHQVGSLRSRGIGVVRWWS